MGPNDKGGELVSVAYTHNGKHNGPPWRGGREEEVVVNNERCS